MAEAGAGGGDASPVEINQVPGDRQTEAESTVGPGAGGARLGKGLKDMREGSRVDPGSEVSHRKRGGGVVPAARDLNPTASGGEFDRIRENIPK